MEQRTHRFQLRLTEREAETLRKNANRAGLSMSEYARKRIAGKAVFDNPSAAWFSVQHALAGMCGTLGQVALSAEDRPSFDTAVEARKIAQAAYALVREAANDHGGE